MKSKKPNGKKEEIDVYDYSQMIARELRKWCLERAFEKRDRTGVEHMAVTNVAEEYYLWITQGKSQGNSLAQTLKKKMTSRRPKCGHVAGYESELQFVPPKPKR